MISKICYLILNLKSDTSSDLPILYRSRFFTIIFCCFGIIRTFLHLLAAQHNITRGVQSPDDFSLNFSHKTKTAVCKQIRLHTAVCFPFGLCFCNNFVKNTYHLVEGFLFHTLQEKGFKGGVTARAGHGTSTAANGQTQMGFAVGATTVAPASNVAYPVTLT